MIQSAEIIKLGSQVNKLNSKAQSFISFRDAFFSFVRKDKNKGRKSFIWLGEYFFKFAIFFDSIANSPI